MKMVYPSSRMELHENFICTKPNQIIVTVMESTHYVAVM